MFLVSFRVENIAAIIFCTSRLASPLQTWETLLKITNKGHLQMLQKGGILPCVDCAVFGKWNYSTVLFNKVKEVTARIGVFAQWSHCGLMHLTNSIWYVFLDRCPMRNRYSARQFARLGSLLNFFRYYLLRLLEVNGHWFALLEIEFQCMWLELEKNQSSFCPISAALAACFI